MKKFATATIEEYLSLPQENSVINLPQKAIKEIKGVKNRADLVKSTLKKYLLNSKQAETNAKILETLLK